MYQQKTGVIEIETYFASKELYISENLKKFTSQS